MKLYDYTILICGGRGPNTWDREIKVTALNIRDALNQADGMLGCDEAIIRIEENE